VRPAVFLDRDGVLNEIVEIDGQPVSPRSLEELEIVAGAPDEVARLRRAGFRVVVVTNQPDVARGAMTRELVDEMNRELRARVGVDAVYVCVHDESDGCACRKPRSGLLERAARDLELDLAGSWLVGDRWVDIAAAAGLGVRSVLLERSHSWRPTSSGAPPLRLSPTHRASSLRECVDFVLA
jgi:D-glycero-D-manno-heptose 1,7-bisphosphate phosphatase